MKPRLLAEGCATRLAGPLLFLRRTVDVGLNEAVEVMGGDGRTRLGRVAAADLDTLTIEVLEATSGLALDEEVVRFVGEPPNCARGRGILGRVFDGVGRVIELRDSEIAGMQMQLYVLRFEKEKMTLRVPFNKAEGVGMPRPRTTVSEKANAGATTETLARRG